MPIWTCPSDEHFHQDHEGLKHIIYVYGFFKMTPMFSFMSMDSSKWLQCSHLCLWILQNDSNVLIYVYGFFKMTPMFSFMSMDSSKWLQWLQYKLDTHRTRYDLRKYFFTDRIVNVWNTRFMSMDSSKWLQCSHLCLWILQNDSNVLIYVYGFFKMTPMFSFMSTDSSKWLQWSASNA